MDRLRRPYMDVGATEAGSFPQVSRPDALGSL